MSELVRFTLRDGGSVVVEVDEAEGGIGPVSRQDGRIHDLHEAFERQLDNIGNAASATLKTLRDSVCPDEVKLTFGVKLTAQAGAVIARTGVEGNLGVELVWKRTGTLPNGAS
jgi:Trypsin-co-occurring domain 1